MSHSKWQGIKTLLIKLLGDFWVLVCLDTVMKFFVSVAWTVPVS